ncbi:hypothetical protein AWENTII_000738 [Aspergillus wentii]
MWEYYHGKVLFITGSSGFLGTALVHRIITQTSPAHIYLLCRGLSRLHEQWQQYLPPKIAQALADPTLVTPIQGDILKPNMGISEHELVTVRERVNIIIHAASSINLVQPLHRISDVVTGATQRIAGLALTCDRLDRFVYVSTAYCNSHLHKETDKTEVHIDERFYPLKPSVRSPWAEWEDLRETGSSVEFKSQDFAWPYSYAKHLAERLLNGMLCHQAQKLLIVRPSIIGPAQQFPYPGFSISSSTPTTIAAASLIFMPSTTFKVGTRSANPDRECTLDEVSVDVVVDRLLAHLAKGSAGIVHAVSGEHGRVLTKSIFDAIVRARRIPWHIEPIWTSQDWHSPDLHPVARLYKILGTSFNFKETKTERIWGRLEERERRGLQLFQARAVGQYDFSPRLEQISATAWELLRRILRSKYRSCRSVIWRSIRSIAVLVLLLLCAFRYF